jgi:hypothetical protein
MEIDNMGISIKNDEVEAKIRRLAVQRGVSLTEAIDLAVSEAMAAEAPNVGHRSVSEVVASLNILHGKYGLDRFRDEDWHKLNDELFDDNGLPR